MYNRESNTRNIRSIGSHSGPLRGPFLKRPELQAQVVDHSWPCQRFHGRKHWTFTEPISLCSNFCVKNTVEFFLVSKKRTMYRYLCVFYIYTHILCTICQYRHIICIYIYILGLYATRDPSIPNSTSPRIPHTSRASSECLRLRCHWGNKGSFEWKPQTVGGLEKRGCSTFNVVSFKISTHRYGSGPKCFTVPVFQNPRRCWSPNRQHRAMVQRRLPCAWVCRSIPAPRSEPGAEHNSMFNWHTIETFTIFFQLITRKLGLNFYANMLCQNTWK